MVEPANSGFARTLLYVPGDQRDRLDKAFGRGADELIVDLEDAVAKQSKATARGVVADWMQHHAARADRIWLRINADTPAEDIETISAPLAGVMVPRAEIKLLARVDELLTAREVPLGIEPGTIALIPLIETARGLLAAVELANMPRVAKLAIGRADLAGELGLSIDPEGPEFRSILLTLVIASSAAGIMPPLAPTSTDFRDLEALRISTENLMRLGFRGRTAVHPAQLAVINEVFTPTPEEVQRAMRLVVAFEDAEHSGSGVVVGDDGRMVDVAVVRSARGVLARARASEKHHPGE
jgi:citrate lyase subunit beta/citryl-CoA lyase